MNDGLDFEEDWAGLDKRVDVTKSWADGYQLYFPISVLLAAVQM